MTKRAVLYCRVSTDEQARSGTSLDKQEEACRKYATSHGFEIVGQPFKDDYTGTVPIEQRPEGRKAYTMLTEGQADALIVFSIDRLVRPPEDGDEWDIPILIRGLARVGKEIHAVEMGKIENTFVGLLLAVVGAKTAGDERRKAKRGWGGVGVPFAYTKVGKRQGAY